MKTLQLYKEDIHKGSLLLVNANHPLPKNFQIHAMMSMPHPITSKVVSLDRQTSIILYSLLEDLNAINDIVWVSGYRSYQQQKEIYNDSLKDNGEEFTKQYVALPGSSEHQTGYAIDLGVNKDNIDFIRPDFPYEGISQDFREQAIRYGFIERYQMHKEGITGISPEPWHFRYVGYPHATIMQEKQMCLEEYIECIKGYTQEQPYRYHDHNNVIEIYYVPMIGDAMKLTLPTNQVYQLSGNNVDGFIVTIWGNVYGS